ncbi:hypothetical protein Aperf_G00000040448 [Anoplocephala perfoliata]
MDRSKWVMVLMMMTSLKTASTSDRLGFKNATITESGENVVFEWYQEIVVNKSQATDFCTSFGSTIPFASELRYFYKSLNLEVGSIFYVQDVIETTTDSPRDDIGEKLCITIKNTPGSPLQIGETNAISSCSTKANSVVCRKTTFAPNSTQYIKCLETYFKDNKNKDLIELERTSFFAVLGAICLVLLIANCLWIILCYKYCSIKQNRIKTRARTSALFDGNGLLKPISLGSDGSELGRYDLLPDVPLQRDSYRKSKRLTERREFKVTNKDDSAESLSPEPGPEPKGTDSDATGFL